MSVLSRASLSRVDEFAQAYASAQPFHHVVMDGFLDAALCAQLLDGFPSFEDRHALNEMGQVGGKAVRMDVRDISPAYRQLDAYLQSPEFLRYVSQVTGIPDLLYDPDYIGGGTHENRHGQSLDTHVDFNYHPRTGWHRRLNLIVYLNPEWEAEWGGTLDLHSDPWNAATNRSVSVIPLLNRAVVFETTETSWHGFSAIQLPAAQGGLSRKSFAVYLYTKTRPADETAPRHATIYVPDAMPAHLVPGHVLDAGDIVDLQQRFSRMRTQLRYLYEREKGFGAQLTVLEYALGEARGAQRLQLQGYATHESVSGLWPDDWAAREVVATLVPTQRVRRLQLDLWAPPQLPGSQRLTIQVNAARHEEVLRPGGRTRVDLVVSCAAGERLELRIQASGTWRPSADGGSADDRDLAYRVLGGTLVH